MGVVNSILNGISNVLNDMLSSSKTGYNQGSYNIKFMSDKQLKKEIQRPHGASFRGLGEQKAYFDEARKRGLKK